MKNKKNRLTAQSPSIFQRFSYLPSKDEFEKKQKENDINQVFELLPSKIVNPPISAFRKKTQPSINFAYKSRKKSYSINFLNILDKQEEASKVDQFFQVLSLKKLKVACELCKISPLERSNDEILGLVKVTSYLKYFEEMNRKKWHKNEQVHERCCALLDYEFLVKGSSVFNQGLFIL